MNPDMCANLLWGECDGHACKCARYVDFVDWCNDTQDKLGYKKTGAYEGSEYRAGKD